MSCSESPEIVEKRSTEIAQKEIKTPDLSEAIAKRIEGDLETAIQILRKQNDEFPDSHEILVQLGRSLFDAENFALAAFRFEQALSCGAPDEIYRESAKASQLSGDDQNAMANFKKYLQVFPDEKRTWLEYARLLAKFGMETEAINAFSKAPEFCSSEDAMQLGDLFFKKKLWTQASRWYRESAKKDDSISPDPLLGLLRVSLEKKDEDDAEVLALAIEKTHPGTIDSSDLKEPVSKLIRRRRLADLLEAGISPQEKKVNELAQALMNGGQNEKEVVISSGPKFSSVGSIDEEVNQGSDGNSSAPIFTAESNSEGQVNLADAFAIPADQEIEISSLEKSRTAFLNANYAGALFHAREAIKVNSSDPEAWRLSSQAHFQLGERNEAEMTILEAIRHNPFDLNTRMDYLRIARETLSGKRYLAELEKAKELFPESTEILWELARRYHLVEKMPVTASILYREVIKLAPPGSALHEQSKMELIKLRSL